MNATEIRNEIATIKRRMNNWLYEGRLDSDTERDMIGEIEALQELQDEIEMGAPAGGLNLDLFAKAIGNTPEELGWDEAA